ncbi:hypothetical protein OV079_02720 [Nannocystis pusilla]|uniref:Lipoprotein n=1 Tax=Nannocystis pusilla TaxID=889268 RepID=A0A9X3IVI6_9BACT|nr:hypothetical protein [Nannocystis pusilla]MCY1004499.1 hypothetical protein [Nannocystis pusilla]
MRTLVTSTVILAILTACDAADADGVGMDGGSTTSRSGTSGGEAEDTVEQEATPRELPPAESLALMDSLRPAAQGEANMTSTVWSKGKGKVALAYASSNTCYLSEVHGKLAAETDSVRVWPENGVWYAEGKGEPSSFSVNCFRKEFAARDTSQGTDGIVSWIRDGDPVGLGLVRKLEGQSLRRRVCFLTEISGPLRDAGDGVALFQLNGGWVLGGSRGELSPGPARASAVCATWVGGAGGPDPAASELKWKQGEAKKPFSLESFHDLPCALTRVSGNFGASNAWVGVWREGQRMFLGGGTSSTSISGAGRCLGGALVLTP